MRRPRVEIHADVGATHASPLPEWEADETRNAPERAAADHMRHQRLYPVRDGTPGSPDARLRDRHGADDGTPAPGKGALQAREAGGRRPLPLRDAGGRHARPAAAGTPVSRAVRP